MDACKRKPTETEDCVDSKKAKEDDENSAWVEAVVDYIIETGANVLDLANRGLMKDNVRSLLTSLHDLKVTELNLENNNLRNGMADIAPLLIKTKITKLNVSEEVFGTKRRDRLTAEDLLQLLEILNDSQITDLSIFFSWGFGVNFVTAEKCIAHLQKSKLVRLNSNLLSKFPTSAKYVTVLKALFNTSLTCLNLSGSKLDSEDFTFLFANLSNCSTVDLNLSSTGIPPKALQKLSRRLAETKIEKLNLGQNKLKSDQLRVLADGLVNSKVTDLDLGGNHFANLHSLFYRLKETRIQTLGLAFNSFLRHEKFAYEGCLRVSSLTSLDLAYCCIRDEFTARLMECIRFTNITKLDIHGNYSGILTVKKFAENVKDLNLTELDINPLSSVSLFVLGKCLKDSKLTCLGICSNGYRVEGHLEEDNFLSFLKLTEESPIRQIKMKYKSIWFSPPLCDSKTLVNTTFTELNLCRSSIEDNVLSLISYLKFSAVTNLNLAKNRITDEGATALAENLKETQITRLNLNENLITSQGAKSLALSLKETNLLYLHLSKNKIGDDGLELLAEYAKDTFLSVLDVSGNSGKRILLVDKVLWQNKTVIHKFASIFKQIGLDTNDEFCFDQHPNDLDVCAFLENCMWFYKTVLDKPAVVGILLEDKNISFSREKIFNLVFEFFPRQFSNFIASKVEADLTEHVTILEKAEEMGLTAIVESLLLNRPLYMLDEEKGILHPRVFKLLLKYKQPICNLAVEPRGVIKIIEYFTEHIDIKGAQEVINVLRNTSIS